MGSKQMLKLGALSAHRQAIFKLRTQKQTPVMQAMQQHLGWLVQQGPEGTLAGVVRDPNTGSGPVPSLACLPLAGFLWRAHHWVGIRK